MAKKIYSVSEAKLSIERYCVYQDRCQYEVEQKLREMGMIPLAIDELMLGLIQDNFVNEERFTRSYIRGKYRIKKWGRIKIEQGLKEKRVPDYCIARSWDEIDSEEYFDILCKLAESKWNLIPGSSYEKWGKTKKFLWSRGFESNLIQEVLNDLAKH